MIGIVRFEKGGVVAHMERSSGIVSWANGTPEEIAKMLESHYKGEIDIADYWAVGDVRTVTIDGIPNFVTAEVQPEQSVELVIIGINHDDKADGSGKAAITVQVKNQMMEAGHMHPDKTQCSLWDLTMRRAWCNYGFKTALPSWLQDLVKPVTKITNRHCHIGYESYKDYRGQIITEDEVFLLSEFEVFGKASFGGTNWGDVGSDGTQYEYMESAVNWEKGGPSLSWWTRSSWVDNNGNSHFVVVLGESEVSQSADTNSGISPGLCI